jgi:hypothetical protein
MKPFWSSTGLNGAAIHLVEKRISQYRRLLPGPWG